MQSESDLLCVSGNAESSVECAHSDTTKDWTMSSNTSPQDTSNNCPENTNNNVESGLLGQADCPNVGDTEGKSPFKHAFEVNVNAIESVPIEEQADEIKNLGLKVFDQQTLEKGIWDQVEQESQRLQTEEELAVIDTSIKKTELILKKSKGKLKTKSKDVIKLQENKINELASLEAKKSLLRERLTQGRKDDENEKESARERSIRLGEMTPFGTVLGTKTGELSTLNKYLQHQQDMQMKMQERRSIKRKTAEKRCTSPKHKRQATAERKRSASNSEQENTLIWYNQENTSGERKKTTEEALGSSIEIVDGEEYLSPALSPGEVSTVDFEESGSEYKPSEDSSVEDFYDEDAVEKLLTEEKYDDIEPVKKDKPKRQKATSKSPADKKSAKRKYKGKTRKKQPQTFQNPDDWATDDSDWLCTDDEISSGSEEPGKRLKRLVKKEVDDGNEEDYFRRLKQWEKSHPDLREQMETDCHELDNDYKVPKLIWDKLYKYQQVGVQWLWELHQQGCGGLLGDEMGLGKTIQIISFLAGLRASRLKRGLQGYRSLGPVLIVCPTTVMHQWVREFHTWCPPIRVAVLHESGAFQGKRHHLIKSMVKAKGVVITSYTAVVRLKDHLLDPNWHYIILDEGHKIRNPDAQVTVVVKQFRTPHRLILSGSPVQNHLRELWSLMDFVFPGKLGTLPVFMAQFGVPIVQGGYANASEVMVATAFKCATVLKDTISPYLMRRMKTDVNSHISLPPKNEQVLFCRLTDAQRDLYKGYLECGEVGRILDGRLQIFVGLINLRKICNHPHLYSGGPKLFAGESEDRIPVEDRYGHWTKAGKMIVMEALLKMWRRQEHRVLIFTQSKQMLGIMESFVIQQGYKYLKLDGGTSISARQPLINKFNQDKSYFVMILTTKVGGLGVNLTGADRVVIYDPDWNPATDTQARERAWRIGQQNCVTVYRLITAGTIEEKMYHRQIFKQFLCNKVLKDPRQRRFFKSNDLMELFTLKEVDTEGSTETSAIFAGTGSQVHVKKKKTEQRPKNSEQRSPSVSKPETSKPSPRKSAVYKNNSNKEEKSKTVNDSSLLKTAKEAVTVQFSESKLQHMKQLAAMLSKKLASKSEANIGQAETIKSLPTEAATSSGQAETIKHLPTEAATSSVSSSSTCEPSPEKGSEAGSPDLPISRVADTLVPSSANSNCDNLDSSVKNALLDESNTAGSFDVESKPLNETSSSIPSGNELSVSSKENISCRLDNSVSSISSEVENTLAGVSTKTPKRKRKDSHEEHSKKHKKHKKHKKEKNAKFEGERVPHLVRAKSMKNDAKEGTVDEIAHNSKQDDYVLRKLFSKTGLQTAMQHDKIMEGGHSDYALIEGEARKVAQEAVKALKESRRQCWSATSGIPTWTGASGSLRPMESQPSTSKLKFGGKKKFGMKKSCTVTSEDPKEEACSSSGLLAKMRARNLLLTENDETQPADKSLVSRSSSELLEDIRAFVAFGAATSEQATTQEIVSHFKDRLPPESSALFKQMLNQVCEFHRISGGDGLWKLLPDFKW